MVVELNRSNSKVFFLILVLAGLKSFAFFAPKLGSSLKMADGEPKINHLAIIMDGNRRWAKQRGLDVWHGHKEGVTALEKTVKFCLARGIKILSVYAFSLENFKRSSKEKEQLFKIFSEVLEHWPQSLNKENVRVRFVGDSSQFPEQTTKTIEKIESMTETHDGLELNLMFCYGGQQEIVDATKKIAAKVKSGELNIEDIDSKLLSENTWTGKLPEPDVIFRTGNRSRLSNFMTLQSAYSEIDFSGLNWPEIDACQLDAMYQRFVKSQRTFGA